MRLLLLSITILSCWAAEADKLPADVQASIDKSEAAVSAAQNEADAKILKVKQALVKDLTKLQEAYTKKGNLDAANGIKAEVDKNKEWIAKQVLAEAPKIAPEAWIVGRWNLFMSSGWAKVWEFDKKGTVTFTGGPVGSWIIKGSIVQVSWPSGNVESIDIPKDMTATETTGTSGTGRAFTVVRAK